LFIIYNSRVGLGTRKNAVVNRRNRGRQKQNFKDQAFKTWLLQGDVETNTDEKYWKGYFEERSALDKLRSGFFPWSFEFRI
jgi:hypothetical protein